jgi:hypothetical protein
VGDFSADTRFRSEVQTFTIVFQLAPFLARAAGADSRVSLRSSVKREPFWLKLIFVVVV